MRFPALLLAVALACGVAAGAVQGRTGVGERAKPSPLHLREHCVRKSDHARVVRFRAADRARLIGVMLGKGPVGVAVGHELRADLCNWLPFARLLARRGSEHGDGIAGGGADAGADHLRAGQESAGKAADRVGVPGEDRRPTVGVFASRGDGQ